MSSDLLRRQYESRRVLVLGASGFIGRWVAHTLARAGADLYLLGRSLERLRAIGRAFAFDGHYLEADLSTTGAFSRAFRQVRPDVTFNLAAYGIDPSQRDESLFEALNVRLVTEICGAIAAAPSSEWTGLRLVHTGSEAEYGDVAGPINEESDTAPLQNYGRSKLQGTRLVSAEAERRGLRGATVRLFRVYGPGERAGRLLPALVAAAKSGEPLALTHGEQQCDFTYVSDAAEGLARVGCLHGPVPGVIHVATGTLTSVRSFAECAAELLGMPPDQLRFGALPYRVGDPCHGPASIDRLKELTGWVPPSIVRAGIRRALEFESMPAKAVSR
ncbi:MAG: NAD-dependent epimerase/dehydratase family protein [Candidatus Acidiferrales bacterium]